MMGTILIANDPAVAAEAEAAGITRIMVDLETMGKRERQLSRTTFITAHHKDDAARIRATLKKAALVVRINPWHADSRVEIDHAVAAGADIIMLPMISQLTQLDDSLGHLKGRARLLPLVETTYSMAHISDIIAYPGIEEVYIGFNDLHLSLGLDFLFEPLALGLIDWMAGQITAGGGKFGFGGIGAIGGDEKLPPEWILGEHARLGSSCVILSSSFCKAVAIEQAQGRAQRLARAVAEVQNTFHAMQRRTEAQQNADMHRTFARIRELADATRNAI